jgi:hypothetical protein
VNQGADSNLQRIADSKLQEIYTWRFVQGIPDQVATRAHWLTRTLLAAIATRDVNLLGGMLEWPDTPERGLHVHGKWCLIFTWIEGIGASEIRLERR